MSYPYTPHVPQSIGEIWDKLGSMALSNPTFKDSTGYFPDMNIETTFSALKEGFNVVRKKLGEERYAKLVDRADRMRALFEADPDDTTGDSAAGRALLWEMEDVLNEVRRRKPANDVESGEA